MMDPQRFGRMRFTVLTPWTMLPASTADVDAHDRKAEQFAQLLCERSERLLRAPCYYPRARAEAYLDMAFRDFEEGYLQPADYCVIAVSSENGHFLDHLYPRLLVFLTRLPAWRDHILVVFLGLHASGSNFEQDLLTHLPITFRGEEAAAWLEDRDAWTQLFQLTGVNYTEVERDASAEVTVPFCKTVVEEVVAPVCESDEPASANQRIPSPTANQSEADRALAEEPQATTRYDGPIVQVLEQTDQLLPQLAEPSDKPNQPEQSEADGHFDRDITLDDHIDGAMCLTSSCKACTRKKRNPISALAVALSLSGRSTVEDDTEYVSAKTNGHADRYQDSQFVVHPPSNLTHHRLSETICPPPAGTRDSGLNSASHEQSFCSMEHSQRQSPTHSSDAAEVAIEQQTVRPVETALVDTVSSSIEELNKWLRTSGVSLVRSATEEVISVTTAPDLETITEKTESLKDISSMQNSVIMAQSSADFTSKASTLSNCSGGHPWGRAAYDMDTEDVDEDVLEARLELELNGQTLIESSTDIFHQISRLGENLDDSARETPEPRRSSLHCTTDQGFASLTSDSFHSPGGFALRSCELSTSTWSCDAETAQHGRRDPSHSPIYRVEVEERSPQGTHTSRRDKHELSQRYRSNSTRWDTRPPLPGNLVRSDGASQDSLGLLMQPVVVDDLSRHSTPCRAHSGERQNEIVTQQLPDGGWLTGIFTWIKGERSATPSLTNRTEPSPEENDASPASSDGSEPGTPVVHRPKLGSILNSPFEILAHSLDNAKSGRRRNRSVNNLNMRALKRNEETKRHMARSHSICGRDEVGILASTRAFATDFAISLINRSVSYMPRHAYWFYTSACLSQASLSQLLAEYNRHVPNILRRAKRKFDENPSGAAALFVGTALTTPVARMLPSALGNIAALSTESLTSDRVLSYRFGTMISYLRPSLAWSGSSVFTRVRPGLYGASLS